MPSIQINFHLGGRVPSPVWPAIRPKRFSHGETG